MAGISVSGLISNSFDWKSVVDQLIQIDSAPIARLQTEEAGNNDKLASFTALKTRLTELQTSIETLAKASTFTGHAAASTTSGSTWSASATESAANGSYTFNVTKLASAAQRRGAAAISAPLSATDDVSGVTLASLPTATAVSAGTFSVNGRTVTVAVTDSLQDVFDKISTATSGAVTAQYSAATDKITLTGGSEVILGAANDTSNFLSVMRLANNGTGAITSSTTLGSAALNAKLGSTSSRLEGALGVDGTGLGQFKINGVAINYDVNTDTLATVIAKVNASEAGVTASYDAANDRVMLINKATGDLDIGVWDETGTLASALGLTTGSTLRRGENAEFTVNGGGTLTSLTNTLDGSAHGIAGLNVTVNSRTEQTINVTADTATMKTAIEDFISDYNAVQSYIDSETKITKGANGKVTAATLANNLEVQAWASELRTFAFGQVSGLTGTIQRLENLGIDFSSKDSTLTLKDSAKLTAALTNKTADVAGFFATGTTGFAARFKTYLSDKLNDRKGALAMQVDTLNRANTGIEAQIATLNRRLEAQRERLTNSFLAMQKAQSLAQQQQSTLTNFLKSSSSSNS